MTVIGEIAAERKRQIDAEGWTTEHDDTHVGGEMALAAAWYTLNAESHDFPTEFVGIGNGSSLDDHFKSDWSWCRWPWDWSWWKPKGRREDLIKAGALIVAEIERLDRRA